MKIKRGDLQKYLIALLNLNMDLIPSTRYKVKRNKDLIESEYKQYQQDHEPIIKKYGTLKADIVEQIDGGLLKVGEAAWSKEGDVVKWHQDGREVPFKMLDEKSIHFVPAKAEYELAYHKEKRELDEMEVDVDIKIIQFQELKRYNHDSKKVSINLPAAADALLGVIIIEDKEQVSK